MHAGHSLRVRGMRDAMSQDRRRRGVALVWVAITILTIVGIVGLSLDYAWGALSAHQLHNGADAGALAGALNVKVDWPRAMNDAIAIAHHNNAAHLPITVAPNTSNDPTGEVVVGRWVRQERQFYPTIVGANAVKVVGNRMGFNESAPPVSLLFGQAFKAPDVKMWRHAIAISTGQRGAGILVLSHDPELDYQDNAANEKWTYKDTGMVAGGSAGASIDLRGPDDWVGDIQINSNGNGQNPSKDAFLVNGAPEIHAANIDVVGSTKPASNDADKWASLYPPPPEIPFNVWTGVNYMDDPLQKVVPPNVAAMPVIRSDTITDAVVAAEGSPSPDGTRKILELQPGYYPGGIKLQNGGSEVHFKIGTTVETSVFALGGGADGKSGLCLNGASLIGNGVMIYIPSKATIDQTAYKSVKEGKVEILGNGYIEISPPGDYFYAADDPRRINGLPGISMWQDRGPAGDPPLGPFNRRMATLGGTANYNLSGTLYFGYNPVTVSGNISKSGNQLLAGALDVAGSISLGVAYDGRNQETSTSSLLVE